MKKYKDIRILGISIWKLCVYFMIYSFFGYIIETIFGIATKGVWESRQSFLYGPFLGIYGIGAVSIILFSQYFRKNTVGLLVGGYVIGSATEYLISFLVEVILHTKWWDYSDRFLNVNGRICLLYSIFWGVLTIFLVKMLNPQIDRLLQKIRNKLSDKALKGIITVATVFMAINCFATCYAQDLFISKMVVEHQINVKDKERREDDYHTLFKTTMLSKFVNTFWDANKMIQTFPNIKIEDMDGNVIYLDSLCPEIQPYYLKVYDK